MTSLQTLHAAQMALDSATPEGIAVRIKSTVMSNDAVLMFVTEHYSTVTLKEIDLIRISSPTELANYLEPLTKQGLMALSEHLMQKAIEIEQFLAT